jgi:DNA-binding beta-propeller fold protein YncE
VKSRRRRAGLIQRSSRCSRAPGVTASRAPAGRRAAAIPPVILPISIAVFAATAALALFSTSSSLAAPPARFGSEGNASGQFNQPRGIAIDQTSSEAYVSDRNNARIDVFGQDGEFLRAFGWGVLDGGAERQVCTSLCFAGLEGSGSGQFSSPTGLAVDNSGGPSQGDLYVIDTGNARVEKFGPGGEFLLSFGGEVDKTTGEDICTAASGNVCGEGVPGTAPGAFEGLDRRGNAIAVGPDGSVYVGDENRVQRFSPAGVVEAQIALAGTGPIAGLAVDSAGDLYVTTEELLGVHKYDSAGTEIGAPRDETGRPLALAVGAADELLVGDGAAGSHVLSFAAGGEQLSSIQVSSEEVRAIADAETAGLLYDLGPAAVRTFAPASRGPYLVSDTETAGEVGTTGARLGATLNPEGEASEFHFQYIIEEAYEADGDEFGAGTEVTPVQSLAADFEDHEVTAPIETLSPGTSYRFRVLAENTAGTLTGPPTEFTTLPAVSVEGVGAASITATSAVLQAELNPHGLPTEFRFEYGPSEAYESVVPVPGGSAGSGEAVVTVNGLIQGLEPITTYHYRVVAHNSLGTVASTDHSFETQGAGGLLLPDDRAWELVSPPDKHGGALEAMTREGGVIQGAAGGEAFTYFAKAPITEDPAGSLSVANSQILARRTPAGWSNEEIATPHQAACGLNLGFLSEYKLFSPDDLSAIVAPCGATPLAPGAGERTPYLRSPSRVYEPIVTPVNTPPGTRFGGIEGLSETFTEGAQFVTASPDLSHVILESPVPLTASAQGAEGENLYEWSGGRLQLASVLPGEERPAAFESGSRTAVGQANLDVRGAVSNDGSRLVFESSAPSSLPHLFLRDLVRGETVQLDRPTAGLPAQAGRPIFQLADPSGSVVYFTDTARLTADSTAREGAPQLYRCSVEILAGKLACNLKDIAVPGEAGESLGLQGAVLGAGGEGSEERVYFVADGVLAPGAEPGDCIQNTTGSLFRPEDFCNLYVYDSSTHATRLIARLGSDDENVWGASEVESGELTFMSARVPPNGRFLAFTSQQKLTGYDNRDAASGHPDQEVYLYDASAGGALRCASCNPSGARPHGIAVPSEGGIEGEIGSRFPGFLVDRNTGWGSRSLAAIVPGWTNVDNQHALYQSRYLSDSGRLFFDAADGLVPGDSNGTFDVYQYEPPQGAGQPASDDCTTSAATYSPASGGCVGLISSGTSSEESALLDASESGDDVFFMTTARLTPEDRDGGFDVYDAHVCSSSSPCITASTSTSPCEAEACQPQAAPPAEAAPATQSSQGSGNVPTHRAKHKHKKNHRKKPHHHKHRKHRHRKHRKHSAATNRREGR